MPECHSHMHLHQWVMYFPSRTSTDHRLIALAAFQFGYDSSYYSGKPPEIEPKTAPYSSDTSRIGILAMQPFLKIYGTYNPVKKLYFMSAAHQSLTSSIINAGEFVGAVSSYYVIDKLGRRGSLFVSSGTVIVGTIIQVASTHIGSLIAGRLVLGMFSSLCHAASRNIKD